MPQCPTCNKDLDTEYGMKVHHKLVHDESIALEYSNCNNCGDKFSYYSSKRVGNYCSTKCTPDPPKYQGEDHPRYNSRKGSCSWCDSNIKIHPSEEEYDNHFCDSECYSKYKSEQKMGKGNHMYIDGSSERKYYTGSWNRVKNKILERDEHMCYVCEKNSGELGKEPDVHHIIPVRMFANQEVAHYKENLLSLCKSCHRFVEENKTLKYL